MQAAGQQTTHPIALSARGLTARRDTLDGPGVVLDGLDLDVRQGEVVDVGGPSGVGKSTLLLALARLLPGVTGRLTLGGAAAEGLEPREWRRSVLYVPQTPVFGPGTVADVLATPWTLKVRQGDPVPDVDEMRGALAALGLEGLSLDRDATRLSVGQAARLALARALLTAPAVLLLDEPDANLDDDSAGRASEAVRSYARLGNGVVRVRHRRGTDVADRHLVLCAGSLEAVPLGS